MGWNVGYTIFEATVIGAYNLGKLDKKLLMVLAAPYQDTDIDSGGSEDLEAKDGLDVVDVVLKILKKKVPLKLPPPPKSDRAPTFEEEKAMEIYYEARHKVFSEIRSKIFRWGR